MTGYSYSRRYIKKMLGGLFIVGGSFLLMEHLFNFQGFDIEFIGHEVIGLVLIGLAFVINIKWKQLPAFLRAVKNRDLEAILDEGERGKYV